MSFSTSEVGESPPAYGTGNTEVNVSNSWTTGAAASGVAMVTCRVCQALIDISGKRDQHVVKCGQCHEATVSKSYIST
jgi:Transmembrane protein 55A